MAHLTCNQHGKRAMVLAPGVIIHRNDGSKCEGPMVVYRKTPYHPEMIIFAELPLNKNLL